MIVPLSLVLFFLGYIAISLEQYTRINKTSISLITGVTLWLLAYCSNQTYIASALAESAQDIFALVTFLLSAMTLVEVLTHYGFFDLLYIKLVRLRIGDKAQFWILTILAFFFSSFLDNLTTTIIFVQIANRLFKGKNFVRTGAAIVIAANAGGAFSPIGDVTTTMLWLAQRFSALEVVKTVFLPSLVMVLVSNFFIGRKITVDTKDTVEKEMPITRAEWVIIMMSLSSFFLPLMMTFFQLPPYLGLLLGLGAVWFAVDLLRLRHRESTKLAVSIEKFFQKTDIASLYFFIGILISIGALRYMGILDLISTYIFGMQPSVNRIISGNIIIGGLSAIFDNIPLTAVALEIVKTDISALWTLLAYTVGVGGSLFVIGSAPGVVAMTLIKELSFGNYMKIATGAAAVGYIFGVFTWLLQWHFFVF